MSKLRSSAPLGASLVVLSSVFYASYGIWTKLTGNFFGGYTASALRSAMVLVILVPIAWGLRQLKPVQWRRDWLYFLGLFLTAALIWGPMYYAVLRAGVGITLSISYACIVIGMFFFGWWWLGEKFTKDKMISALLGFVGLLLVFSPSMSGQAVVPMLAALVAGLACAAHYVIIKKLQYSATQSTILAWMSSVLANTLMAWAIGESLPASGFHIQWAYLAIFAAASVVATWSFVSGVRRIEVGAAGIIGLLEIVFGVLFGMVFFGERPGALVLFGVVVIIAAAAIPYVKDYNAKRGTLEEKRA